MPGSGRRLGDGAEDTGEAAGDGEGEAEETRGFSLGTCRSGAEAAEHAIAADLVSAASGGGNTVTSTHRALRKCAAPPACVGLFRLMPTAMMLMLITGETHSRTRARAHTHTHTHTLGRKHTRTHTHTVLLLVLLHA